MKAIDVYNDVEYLHITRHNKTLLQFGKEINGKKKSEIQSLIGLKLGEDRFNYSLKLNNDGKIYRGTIRAFIPESAKTEKEKVSIEQIKINELENKLNQMNSNKGNEMDFDKILSMQEKIYKTQIDFITKQMDFQTKQIEQLQKNQSDSGGFDLTSLILPLIMKKGQATMNLKDNATGNNYDLPDSLINVVSKIDYSKLTPDQIENLCKQLNQLITIAGIPKKES